MKALLLSLFLIVAAVAAQPMVTTTKPPVGVPADAKFFNGKWYRVYLEKVPWNVARDKCKSLGGQLVNVPDATTWDFVKGLGDGAKLWLGANDSEAQGVWKWSDGTVMKFNAWAHGQPDNVGGVEHFLAAFKNGWNDMPNHPTAGVNTVSGYICEWVPK